MWRCEMPAWTTERPTCEGYYWYRDGYIVPGIVRVVYTVGRLVPTHQDDSIASWDTFDHGQWFGPLQPPPMSPTAPSMAEAMAMAVLAGDMVAARGLADWLVEHDAGRTLAVSPAEFAVRMRAIVDDDSADAEDDHMNADRLLAETLRALGYGEGITVYDSMHKWYS